MSQRNTHAEPITSASDTSIFDTAQKSNRKNSDHNSVAQRTAATLEQENARLKDDVKQLRELVRLQKQVTGGTKVVRKDVDVMAKLLNAEQNQEEGAPAKKFRATRPFAIEQRLPD